MIVGCIIVGVLAYILGVFGFAQVIGSIQTRQKIWGVTVIVWLILLAAGWFVVYKFFGQHIIGLYVGYGLSFVSVLLSGRIQ